MKNAERSLIAIIVAISFVGQSAAQQVPNLPNNPTIEEVAEAGTAGAAWTPPGTNPQSASSSRIMLTPTPARKFTDYAASGVATDIIISTLSQDQLRPYLDQIDESVTVEMVNTDGSLTSLPVSASMRKGTYRVTYYWYRYRNEPCLPNNIGGNAIAIGVGIRVTATVRTSKAGVNISQIIPLAVAVSRERASGNLRVQAHGIASGSSSVSTYLNAAAGLSPDSIRNAVESFGVVKAISETSNVTLSPNYLFIDGPNPQACAAAVLGQPAAT
jgi:hypothetical protein